MTTSRRVGLVSASTSVLMVQSVYSPAAPWSRYSTGKRAVGSSANVDGSRRRTIAVPTTGNSMVRSRMRGPSAWTLTTRAPSSAGWPIVASDGAGDGDATDDGEASDCPQAMADSSATTRSRTSRRDIVTPPGTQDTCARAPASVRAREPHDNRCLRRSASRAQDPTLRRSGPSGSQSTCATTAPHPGRIRAHETHVLRGRHCQEASLQRSRRPTAERGSIYASSDDGVSGNGRPGNVVSSALQLELLQHSGRFDGWSAKSRRALSPAIRASKAVAGSTARSSPVNGYAIF